jgi:hypothetical protein
MIERIASASGLILSAGATAAGSSVATTSTNPYAWLIPVVCGCLAALIVRGITVTTPTKRKKVWRFELLVTLLVLLLTGVIVEEQAMSVMRATFLGIGLGGMGVGVISFFRNASLAALKSMLSASETSKP